MLVTLFYTTPSTHMLPPTAPIISSHKHPHKKQPPIPPPKLQATLAAANVAGILQGFGAWPKPDNITPFIEKPIPSMPKAAPSLVNAKEL